MHHSPSLIFSNLVIVVLNQSVIHCQSISGYDFFRPFVPHELILLHQDFVDLYSLLRLFKVLRLYWFVLIFFIQWIFWIVVLFIDLMGLISLFFGFFCELFVETVFYLAFEILQLLTFLPSSINIFMRNLHLIVEKLFFVLGKVVQFQKLEHSVSWKFLLGLLFLFFLVYPIKFVS